jgi:hypothetical protein
MKNLIVLLIFLAITFACSPFSTRYERIEPDALRVLGIFYSPYPEASPKDTVNVTACFAGDSIISSSWTISYDVIMDVYGTDTFLNVIPLAKINYKSFFPDSESFSFVVPESVFFKTAAISQNKIDIIKPLLPSFMQSMDKNELADILQQIADLNYYDPAVLDSLQNIFRNKFDISQENLSLDSIFAAVAILVNTFSIKAYIFADVISKNGKKLKVKSDFIIRYNKRFANIPYAPFFLSVNTNPKIRWLGIYKIKGNNLQNYFFSPNDSAFKGKFEITYLYNEIFPDSVRDTILIDTGYIYYLGADSGIVTYIKNGTLFSDTSRDKICNFLTGDCQLETFYYDWFYQNLDLDSVTMPLDSLLTAIRTTQPYTLLLPSLDVKMKSAYFWVVVIDSYLGQYNRPTGMCIRHARCFFKYSDAYVNYVKKRK